MDQVMQCVPNFSEGRRPVVMNAIAAAAASVDGAMVVDWSGDADHNRMVVTIIGTPASVMEAALAAFSAAIGLINLKDHAGVHPRLGVVDVLPFIPLRGMTMTECVEVAKRMGEAISSKYEIPVFYYEFSAAGRSLPFVRKNAFDSLQPDLGPSSPHATAGSTVIGARGPLIAYNVDLGTSDLKVGKRIASAVREGGSSGFAGVRALGLFLPSTNRIQVSINVTRPELISLHALFIKIVELASEAGVQVMKSEVIGALPGYSAFETIRDALKAPNLKAGQVLLESWPEGRER